MSGEGTETVEVADRVSHLLQQLKELIPYLSPDDGLQANIKQIADLILGFFHDDMREGVKLRMLTLICDGLHLSQQSRLQLISSVGRHLKELTEIVDDVSVDEIGDAV